MELLQKIWSISYYVWKKIKINHFYLQSKQAIKIHEIAQLHLFISRYFAFEKSQHLNNFKNRKNLQKIDKSSKLAKNKWKFFSFLKSWSKIFSNNVKSSLAPFNVQIWKNSWIDLANPNPLPTDNFSITQSNIFKHCTKSPRIKNK